MLSDLIRNVPAVVLKRTSAAWLDYVGLTGSSNYASSKYLRVSHQLSKIAKPFALHHEVPKGTAHQDLSPPWHRHPQTLTRPVLRGTDVYNVTL